VLLVSANFRPSVGGIERFVEILADGLAERGHEVTVVTCRTPGTPRREHAGAVEIVRIPATDVMRERFKVPYPIPAPPACVRTLRELVRRADVVHVQDAEYLTSVTALMLTRKLGVPAVLTQHVAFVTHGHVLLDLGRHAVTHTLGWAARLASVVVAVNPSVAEWARRTWRLHDVRALPAGFPRPIVAPNARALVRRELGLAEDAFVALFAGRDVPRKRLDVFLAAGDPSYELVAVTDRTDHVLSGTHIVPFMSPDRFGRMLAAADAFVLPSEGEVQPLVLREALIAGIPCVVAREPGYERLLADDDVVFVPPEPAAIQSALRRLAADPEYRRRLAQRAQRAGEREIGVDRFIDAYERLYTAVRSKVR
jgi:rhamnosyl/mannosyltransferase